MANSPEAERQQAIRLRTEAYGSGPVPEHASLIYRSGMAVMVMFMRNMLVNARGRPLHAVRAEQQAQAGSGIVNLYDILDLTLRHPARTRPDVTRYWYWPEPVLDRGRLASRQALGEYCAEGLRMVLTDSPYWDPLRFEFKLGPRPITYGELGEAVGVMPVARPHGPYKAMELGRYAADIGSRVLRLTADRPAQGGGADPFESGDSIAPAQEYLRPLSLGY
ncbi:MAG TPA: hypothetical protein VLF40_04205 [Candidatus Saccharimonadales bacterium]|nr:hypothetical protein [Candidatus Saccharimonadales bacterium]